MQAKNCILFFALVLSACSSSRLKIETPASVQINEQTIKTSPPLLNRFNEARTRMIELAGKLTPIFKDRGVPTELLAMPIIQSDYLSLAEHQKEHIAGLWSFSPYTANLYGLNTEPNQDDRLDPVKSTRAAADYLNHLHTLFHDWRWAILAYTYGESEIEVAKEQNPNLTPWEYEASPKVTKPRLSQTWAIIALIRELNHE